MKRFIVAALVAALFVVIAPAALAWGPNPGEQGYYMAPGVQFATPGNPYYYPDPANTVPLLSFFDTRQTGVTDPQNWQTPQGGCYTVEPHPEEGYMQGFGWPAWTGIPGAWNVRGVDTQGRAGWFDTSQITNVLIP